ncbi:hypothetical protein VM57_09510 [Stenotrophomonas maltophilia]|uniref:Uncharacterized protein n=1 Tax=Stenotrophomonas maltophilia TaxID=40324 RepID=A0A0F5ZNU2_STEMA|nr:hypothetical protein VM57_09510 [Stenotrophomonas maltophilia]
MLCPTSKDARVESSEAVPLFDRLNPGLFRLLGMPNGQRYWAVICRLMAELWGDGGLSPGEDVQKTAVVRAIESYLAADDPWDGDLEPTLRFGQTRSPTSWWKRLGCPSVAVVR